MGANHSTRSAGSDTRGHGGLSSTTGKTCYYEILGVERLATEDEAYRKKALDLHPDRNYGNVEATTEQFAEVQSAYAVLSDPQERAWYDSHRDAILRDEDGAPEYHYHHNVRVTTTDDILRMFKRINGQMDFTNSATGFYGFLRETFDVLAREEQAACEWEGFEPVDYPSFGHAGEEEEHVRLFYAKWASFATQKTFSWKDAYRYSEAPDRRIRRLMEKENKRVRDEGIRTFNEAVRSFVAFVKKRDLRVKQGQMNEAERQSALRDAASAQAARSRAANQANTARNDALPEWMRSSEPPESEISDEDDPSSPREEIECVVCSKSFKSENQYEAHQKSKKHLRAVQELRRQMRRPSNDLDSNAQSTQTVQEMPWDKVHGRSELPDDIIGETAAMDFALFPNGHEALKEPAKLGRGMNKLSLNEELAKSSASLSGSASSDDCTSGEGVQKRISGSLVEGEVSSLVQAEDGVLDQREQIPSSPLERDGKPKMGKAKEKRAKKAAQKTTTNSDPRGYLICAACQADFPSKTRLFKHIRDLGHAQALANLTTKGNPKLR
ncbi:MAG: hypothetical protein Q9163_005084 [Psora crenata]